MEDSASVKLQAGATTVKPTRGVAFNIDGTTCRGNFLDPLKETWGPSHPENHLLIEPIDPNR